MKSFLLIILLHGRGGTKPATVYNFHQGQEQKMDKIEELFAWV